MSKIFFLLFFSLYAILGSENYNCTFEKISSDACNIQKDALTLDKCFCNEETNVFVKNAVESLRRQSQDFVKENYCFDGKFKTAVCLQGNNEKFQIPFYDQTTNVATVHHKYSIETKPLCVAVSDRFVFHISNSGEFCFIQVPNKYSSIWSEQWVKIEFKNANNLLNFSQKIYCFPGDSGQFYLTNDQETRTNIFLFKIEVKKIESFLSKKAETLNENIKKDPQDTSRSRLNFSILRFVGLAFFFLATIFLYRKYYSN